MELEIGSIVVLTTALTQVIKVALGDKLPKSWKPILAMLVGVALFSLMGLDGALGLVILRGIIVGLASCGLYDVTKYSVLGKE